ncbi:MAG: sugar phosphate isomerase/epimerase family protein [bacterium]|nr:sugar phosphate isomerase/epimerase family protein [bacterium]
MTKIAIGSWAYVFGPYSSNPVPLDKVVMRLSELGFDGIELCGFKPHVHPDDYPTKEKRQEIVNLLKDHNLEPVGIAADFTATLPGAEGVAAQTAYLDNFKKNIELCADIGIPKIRVDTCEEPPAEITREYEKKFSNIVAAWQKASQIAQDAGIGLIWEFEPGFIFNKPSEITRMVKEVGHPNFKILLDSCHAHMVADQGAKQPPPKETLSGGAVELIGRLNGKIGHIHLIDSDNTLHDNMTSTHAPFGQGVLDFDKIMPAIMAAGYDSEWWSVDLCFWPEAWEVTEAGLKFVRGLAEKYGK